MNKKKYKVAVVGATGNVGREIINSLSERNFPVAELFPVASERSLGKCISFGEKSFDVLMMEDVAFQNCDIVLSSCGSDAIKKIVMEKLLPIPFDKRPILIDNSSAFRMDEDVPLIVPEINAAETKLAVDSSTRKIIANPNCSTIQTAMVLNVIHQHFRVNRVIAATYQSVSGNGKEAMDELFYQTKGIFVNQPLRPAIFTKKIAFNVIPHVDVFMDDGMTKEEWKMRVEIKKIVDQNIDLFATCVRVPVFVGHGVALHIVCEGPIDEIVVRETLREAEGITVIDSRHDEGYVTPEECSGEDSVYVSRIRKDPSMTNGIALWCVADNLRKGAALNAVQIAESLIEQHLI